MTWIDSENIAIHHRERTDIEALGSAPDATTSIRQHSIEKQANTDTGDTSIDEGLRLYVGSLPFAATEDHVREFFSGFSM